MKKISLLLVMLLLISVWPAAAQEDITTACLVTDIGRIDDGTFNQYAYEGLTRVAGEYGLETFYVETVNPEDYAQNIDACINEGFEVIVTVGFAMADATRLAAAANPDLYFIGVDQFVDSDAENYVGVQFREDEAGFLVGVLAALVTDSGVVAGVYGMEIPPVIKFRHGFEQGVRYAVEQGMTEFESIEILGVYIPDFNDPEGGAAAAQGFIDEGADVIFGAGGRTGTGGIQAAAQQGVYVIGVDQDQYFTDFAEGEVEGAQYLISSALKRVDVGVYDMIEVLLLGDMASWPGGSNYILSTENGGITYAPAHDAEVDAAIYDMVEDIEQLLADGDLNTGVDPITGAMLEAEE